MAMWTCSKCRTTLHADGGQIVTDMIEHQSRPCVRRSEKDTEVSTLDVGVAAGARTKRR